MSSRQPAAHKKEYLNKRFPANPRFQDVKCKVNTGHSVTNYKEKREEMGKYCKYRDDEQFKRIKVTTFAQVVLQVALASDLCEQESDSEAQRPEDLECAAEQTAASPHTIKPSDHQEAANTPEICYTSRRTLFDLISGVGELSLETKEKRVESESDQPYPDCPYLLLDIRDSDAYERCHIITAHSYPLSLLSRTSPLSKEVFEYRNKPGKIIIVYDEDETVAREAATRLTQLDAQNVFMLTGGLKMIAEKFPEGLTTGSIPTSCPSSARRKKSLVQQQQQQQQVADSRWRFTAEDVTKIQEQLEKTESTPSSRSSSQSSFQSRRSHRSAVSHGGFRSARQRNNHLDSGPVPFL